MAQKEENTKQMTQLSSEEKKFLGKGSAVPRKKVFRLEIPFRLRVSLIWMIFFAIIGIIIQSAQADSFVFIDFFGIHIFQTFQVNLSLLPIYYVLAVPTNEVNLAMYLASSFTFLAVLLETIADRVIVMDAGEIIAEGELKDVINNPKVKEAYFEG